MLTTGVAEGAAGCRLAYVSEFRLEIEATGLPDRLLSSPVADLARGRPGEVHRLQR